ncbi:MAG: hypothetical protein KDD39_04880 [Bdellovibrionales bacterium]|nr:hypothetical protein [Bdellovibrionales bacterium]
MIPRWTLFIAVIGSLLAASAFGRSPGHLSGGYYETEDPWTLSTWGSFKSIAAYEQLRQTNIYTADSIPFAEQRLRLGGALTKGNFRFEFANEVNVTAQPPNPTVVPIPYLGPKQAFDLTAEIYTSDSLLLRNYIDRAFVQYTLGDWEFKVGRQVVPMGIGKIYTAISQIPRRSFVVVDSEYPVTEDAVAVTYAGPMTLSARFLPKIEGQQDHNFHVRLGEQTMDYDLVLTAGKSDDKLFFGFEGAKNYGGFVFRGEAVAYKRNNDTILQGLFGMDRAFTPEFSGLVEVFYNGFGSNNPLSYNVFEQSHRSAPYIGQLYLGTNFNAQITPLFEGHLGSSTNLNDGSTLFHLYFNYSLSDELDLIFGQYFSVSPDPLSEYGGRIPLGFGFSTGLPDLSYFVLKYSF